MKRSIVLVVLALLPAGCSRAPAPQTRQFEVIGQILSMDPAERQVVIKHEDIKDFMIGMTMPFEVTDASVLEGKQPGDLINATLVVTETGTGLDAHISAIRKTGSAPLDAPVAVSATDGAVLQPGDVVPDQVLVDQDGRPRPLSSLRGHRVAMTFTYLRCPLPEFCPLMDRHFAEVQKTIKATPALADVQLVSVSFDPAFDTPAELKKHAQALGADPRRWTFATATDEEMATLTRRFGVLVEREGPNPGDITHNLRTAVIDPEGRVVTVHTGRDWTPAQLVADLTAAPAPAR
jgi:protein SCO1/2